MRRIRGVPLPEATLETAGGGVNSYPYTRISHGGFYYSGIVIDGHMLPARSFKEAIQNIPEGTPPEKVLKSYMPVAAYCEPQTFERVGADGCLSAPIERE